MSQQNPGAAPLAPTDPHVAKREIAALDFEYAKTDAIERLKFQAQFAEVAWRSLALINGGAIVALFTFIGNAHPSIDYRMMWISFGFFAGGLVFNILSILTGFLAQAFYMKATMSGAWNEQMQMHGYEPLHRELQKTENRWGGRWEASAIVACLLSLAAFIGGAGFALQGVSFSGK